MAGPLFPPVSSPRLIVKSKCLTNSNENILSSTLWTHCRLYSPHSYSVKSMNCVQSTIHCCLPIVIIAMLAPHLWSLLFSQTSDIVTLFFSYCSGKTINIQIHTTCQIFCLLGRWFPLKLILSWRDKQTKCAVGIVGCKHTCQYMNSVKRTRSQLESGDGGIGGKGAGSWWPWLWW